MKRILSIVLIFASLAVVLSGCNGGGTLTTDKSGNNVTDKAGDNGNLVVVLDTKVTIYAISVQSEALKDGFLSAGAIPKDETRFSFNMPESYRNEFTIQVIAGAEMLQIKKEFMRTFSGNEKIIVHVRGDSVEELKMEIDD